MGSNPTRPTKLEQMEKAELIHEIQEAYDRLAALVARIPDDRLLEPAMGDWTAKDLLAHITWWHDHSARVAVALHTGRDPYDREDPANEVDARNERVHAEHRDDPPEVARRELAESFRRLLDALAPLSGEDLLSADRWPWLDGQPLQETILWDSSRHYRDHFDHLERLARPDQAS